MKSKFFEQVKESQIEREVEDVYNRGLNIYYKNVPILHPYACDGYMVTKTPNGKDIRLLIEYKLNEDLKTRQGRAKILIQVLYYLKHFDMDSQILPNVILIGDINECFVIHPNSLIKYLNEKVDWSIAPSQAYQKNSNLLFKIAMDEEINPYIFNIDENFSFKDVVNKINDQAENVKRYVYVSEHNISIIYDYFIRNVILKGEKIQANDLVAMFIGIITNNNDYYLHPKKSNILVTPLGDIRINTSNYKAFFNHYGREYTPEEKDTFASISDRLIEDENRRRKGEFYTPTLFVDEAHKRLTKQFGENWKNEYVVWDCASGTKNLTRDYKFKELYSSTLEEGELEISRQYNPEGTAFQFDFLNDPIEKAPQGLRDALENDKPIIFFINPPYVSPTNFLFGKDNTKKGIGFTKIHNIMAKNKISRCSSNLCAQFLYRIILLKQHYKLTNCNLGLFCPDMHLAYETWNKLRNVFLKEFDYKSGVLFQASEFANVANYFGIAFTIYKTGETQNKNYFLHTLIENQNNTIVEIGTKNIYNTDNLQPASKWVREELKGLNKYDAPQLTSGIKIKQNGIAKLVENSLGYFFNSNNTVAKNTQEVALFSSCFSSGGGLSITNENFTKCMNLFSARRMIIDNWIEDKDSYLRPDENNPLYNEFSNDAIIYSLFEPLSSQSSLRQIDYKNKKWDIKNNFFWMSKSDMLQLANENNLDEMYQDCKTDDDRFVYNKLKEVNLSSEAQAVLDKATEMVKNSIKYRTLYNETHPEYQVMNWDCGYYQLKNLWREYMPEEFKEFRDLFKILENKMRPMVYELGFLKK